MWATFVLFAGLIVGSVLALRYSQKSEPILLTGKVTAHKHGSSFLPIFSNFDGGLVDEDSTGKRFLVAFSYPLLGSKAADVKKGCRLTIEGNIRPHLPLDDGSRWMELREQSCFKGTHKIIVPKKVTMLPDIDILDVDDDDSSDPRDS